MNDLIYNIGVSGGITTLIMVAEKLYDSICKTLYLKQSTISVICNKEVKRIYPQIKNALEDFLKTDSAYIISKYGHAFDDRELVESEILRRSGIQKEDIFKEEVTKLRDYKFIINFTSSAQHGFEDTQKHVTLLTKTVAKAATDIGCPVAINGIGSDYVVLKDFHNDLDFKAIDRVKVDQRLNLYKSLEKAAKQDKTQTEVPSIILYIINGYTQINDTPRQSILKNTDRFKETFNPHSIVLFYEIRNVTKEKTSIPFTEHNASFYHSYHVDDIFELERTFCEFISRAKPYRCR